MSVALLPHSVLRTPAFGCLSEGDTVRRPSPFRAPSEEKPKATYESLPPTEGGETVRRKGGKGEGRTVGGIRGKG